MPKASKAVAATDSTCLVRIGSPLLCKTGGADPVPPLRGVGYRTVPRIKEKLKMS
jgi:hypothetical protein